MPKVSVLMPVYKTDENYLREAIESILAQTFTDFEFLILDDCPENDREAVVKSYNDQRIKYFKNEKNLGISESRNKLMDLAEGEYLAVFDHDDISLPQRLEKEVTYLDAHPEIGVVSCLLEYFPKKWITPYPENNLDIKKQLMTGNIVAHTGMMLRKSVLRKNNIRYEENYSPAEDQMLCLRLISCTMFHNLQEVLVKYRDFAENTSHTQHDKMKNAGFMCRNFAQKEYPFFHNDIYIKLFNTFPFIRIRYYNNTKRKIYLFGIPLLTIKGE